MSDTVICFMVFGVIVVTVAGLRYADFVLEVFRNVRK